jgi:tetratricopeptide (TPR) repeat protein
MNRRPLVGFGFIVGVASIFVLSRPITVVAQQSGAKSASSAAKKKTTPAIPKSAPPATVPVDAPKKNADGAETKAGSSEAQSIAARALAAFRKNDLAAAKKGFEKVLELAPENAAALINLGLIAYREKNLPDAEKLLMRAVRAAPDAGAAWLILGIARYDAHKLDGALAALAQAVWLEPKDARAHQYFGATLGAKGWYAGGEEEMRKALEIDADYADAHYNLALLYLQRNPPAIELARRHYYKAVELGASADPEVEKKLSAAAPATETQEP